jgi:hypothetical protein
MKVKPVVDDRVGRLRRVQRETVQCGLAGEGKEGGGEESRLLPWEARASFRGQRRAASRGPARARRWVRGQDAHAVVGIAGGLSEVPGKWQLRCPRPAAMQIRGVAATNCRVEAW